MFKQVVFLIPGDHREHLHCGKPIQAYPVKHLSYSSGPPLSIYGPLDAFWHSGSVGGSTLFGALGA